MNKTFSPNLITCQFPPKVKVSNTWFLWDVKSDDSILLLMLHHRAALHSDKSVVYLLLHTYEHRYSGLPSSLNSRQRVAYCHFCSCAMIQTLNLFKMPNAFMLHLSADNLPVFILYISVCSIVGVAIVHLLPSWMDLRLKALCSAVINNETYWWCSTCNQSAKPGNTATT